VLRQGLAIGWIEDALAPLRETQHGIDVLRLPVAIPVRDRDQSSHLAHRHRRFSRDEAADTRRTSARALLRAALAV
jgi:hypothetical protein